MTVTEALVFVETEVYHAMGKHHSFRSAHEAYAVLLEEVDEVWDEVKKKNPSSDRLREELIQVAAMAIRSIVDLGV